MLTHKQVSKLNWSLRKQMGTDAPRVIKATEIQDASMIAVHLLNPRFIDIEDALEVAQKDNFKVIVIHTARTFGKVV
jgi:hypothetical protein